MSKPTVETLAADIAKIIEALKTADPSLMAAAFADKAEADAPEAEA